MPSQQEEDLIIADYFGSLKDACYIDIGAGDPVELSNTYNLYNVGWKGLVFEPYDVYHKRWAEIRPNDIVLNEAVTNYDGKIEMCNTATVGSWVGDEYKEKAISGEIERTLYTVPCKTIDTILKKYPEFLKAEFISIDVESNEKNILSEWNFDIFKPKVICIERQLRGKDRTYEWDKYLLPHYKLDKETGTNAFYTRL